MPLTEMRVKSPILPLELFKSRAFAGVNVATLLLYGDKDLRAPLKVAHDLHARIPGSRLVVIQGVGHMSRSFERPASTVRKRPKDT